MFTSQGDEYVLDKDAMKHVVMIASQGVVFEILRCLSEEFENHGSELYDKYTKIISNIIDEEDILRERATDAAMDAIDRTIEIMDIMKGGEMTAEEFMENYG